MKLNRWHNHSDTIRVELDEPEAHQILAEAVAKEAGIALDDESVAWEAYFNKRDSSTGFTTQCTIKITVDLRQRDQCE